jgi:hypothetical protein
MSGATPLPPPYAVMTWTWMSIPYLLRSYERGLTNRKASVCVHGLFDILVCHLPVGIQETVQTLSELAANRHRLELGTFQVHITGYRYTNLLVLGTAIWPQPTLHSSLYAMNPHKTACSTSPQYPYYRWRQPMTLYVGHSRWLHHPQNLQKFLLYVHAGSSAIRCRPGLHICLNIQPQNLGAKRATSTLRTRKHCAPSHKIQ